MKRMRHRSIKRKSTEEKGYAGIGLMIIVTFLIVCVLLPIWTVVFEKKYANAVQVTVHNQVHAALQETAGEIELSQLAGQEVVYQAEVEAAFRRSLQKHMRVNQSLSPENGSIADGPLRLIGLHVYHARDGIWHDQKGRRYDRPGIEVELSVPIQPHFYASQLLEEGEDTVQLVVRQVYTVPVNR